MNNDVIISNYRQLLDFINRDEVNSDHAKEIVCTFLNVICLNDLTKDEIIKLTENYINKFCNNDNSERPLFLDYPDYNLTN